MRSQLTVTRLEFDLLDALDRLKAKLRRQSNRTVARAEIVRAILRGVVFADANITACCSAAELEMQIRSRLESNHHSRQPKSAAPYHD